ncbi:MAG: hypothetical protein GX196_04790 [Clostridiaceae bacterium]|nr:hypothetical protein [Clostridiaceae bacterium]
MVKVINKLCTAFFVFALALSFSYLILEGKILGILFFSLFFVLQINAKKILKPLGEGAYLALILACAFAIRLIFAIFVNPAPESDFLTYYNLAKALSQGKTQYNEYIALFPHVIGYPTILSFFFTLFGDKLIVAKILNVISQTATVYLVYKITEKVNPKGKRCAAAFLAFCPNLIYPVSLVATENFHIFFLALSIYLYLINKKRAAFYILSGLFFALSNFIRPVSIIFIASILIYEFLRYRMNFKRIVNLFLLLISFFAAFSALNYYTEKRIGQSCAKNSFGYNLYVGLNHESMGMWNEEDAKTFDSLSKKNSPQNVHNIFIKKSIERFFDIKTIPLLFKKQVIMWADEGYFAWWDKLPFIFFILAQSYYVSIFSLCALNLIKNKSDNGQILFFEIVIILTVLSFTLLEAQGRYRLYLYLAFCTISSGFFWHKNLKNNEKILKKVL